MRFFIDTNLVTEFLFGRTYANEVAKIFKSVEDGKNSAFISNGSFYTLTYLIDCNLKKQGFANPDRLAKLRDALNKLLNLFQIAELNVADFVKGVNDFNFSDLEDSYQYQAAKKSNCDFLVTINTTDFPKEDFVVTPSEVVENFSLKDQSQTP